jgi:MFS family permease
VPAANKIGRRFVFLASTIITAASSIWAGAFHGTPQWMLNNAMNGIGTAAYQAIIQLTVGFLPFLSRHV